MRKLVWRDISSYVQQEKRAQEPKSVEAQAPSGWPRLIVTRHRDFPDAWVMRAYDMRIDIRQLEAETLEQAKLEATALARERLSEALEAFSE